MHRLNHPYPSVQKDQTVSFGGNQNWSDRRDLRRCGCGAVAMTDLVLYLTRHHHVCGPKEADQNPIPLADYDRLCSSLQRKYLPMVPPLGINGIVLAGGISLWLQLHRVPLLAVWGVRMGNFWSVMEDMLDRDLPVIFSIGPNFPLIWQKYKVNLYQKTGEACYTAVSRVKAHYITATGLDENWIRISSWGKEYYIHRGEYEEYGKTHSVALVNNLLWLKETRGTQ